MKVSELIEKLKNLPQDADVGLHWDGNDHSDGSAVWLARSGRVLIGSADYYIYSTEDRIESAPTREDNPYLEVWEMLGLPKPHHDSR